MIITWYGQACFKIVCQKNKNGQVVIITDLPEKDTGLRGPKPEADILLESRLNKKKGSDSCFLITGPGEYDVKEIYIQGIASSDKKTTIYIIEAEDMKICHLGEISQKELSSQELEMIGVIDILTIPVGGGNALEAKDALKIMSQIEPKIIIPMCYKIPKLKIRLDPLDNFLKTLGIKKLESSSKLSIKAKGLPKEEVKIIALQA